MMPEPDPPRGADEWLVTDGRGGYALGTPAGWNLRRYHGLLVCAEPPPRGRVLHLARTEEVVVTAAGEESLEAAFYAPDVVVAHGPERLAGFEADPVPTWTWRVAGGLLRRRLVVHRDRPACTLLWDRPHGGALRLLVRPLLASRSHHHLLREGSYAPEVDVGDGLVRWRRAPELPWLGLAHGGSVAETASWFYRDVRLPTETERGYDDVEDLHAPVRLGFELAPGETAWLSCGPLDEEPLPRGDAIELPVRAPVEDAESLAERGVEDFVVEHEGGAAGIIAGYPWFEEWARDTMIALPGLLLGTGRQALARELLEAWAGRLRDGLLPNRLDDLASEADRLTNSADAPLLFVRAVALLDESTYPPRSAGLVLERAVLEVLDRYHAGTAHGIGVDAKDGLLVQGEDGLALTWMDAVCDGVPVTPRRGKAIDLNALWLEALRYGLRLAGLREDDRRARALRRRVKRVESSLGRRFTDPEGGFLRDVIDSPEGAPWIEPLRPGVLFALRLEESPIPDAVARRTLERVENELLTPYGLRTLEPSHPRYRGTCAGDQLHRDRAYHQGTVWPWLIGPYVDAALQVRGAGDEVKEDLRRRLAPLLALARQRGTLPEILDGDAPHRARGCPAQAWSVAEVARALALIGG